MVGLSVDKFASQSLNVSVDKVADVLVGWSVSRWVSWLINWQVSQSVGLSVILCVHLRMLESYQLVYKVEKI